VAGCKSGASASEPDDHTSRCGPAQVRQTRGGDASSCQAIGRQARQTATSSSIAGSTRGASTRSTITPGSTAVQPRLSGDDVLYWRSDIF